MFSHRHLAKITTVHQVNNITLTQNTRNPRRRIPHITCVDPWVSSLILNFTGNSHGQTSISDEMSQWPKTDAVIKIEGNFLLLSPHAKANPLFYISGGNRLLGTISFRGSTRSQIRTQGSSTKVCNAERFATWKSHQFNSDWSWVLQRRSVVEVFYSSLFEVKYNRLLVF